MSAKKIFPDDEGDLAVAVYVKEDNIIIDFGKSVTWLGLDKPAAEALVRTLQDKLKAIE